MSVECEKAMANDENRLVTRIPFPICGLNHFTFSSDRERTFLYGITQSLCALLNTLSGGGEEGAEEVSLQVILLRYLHFIILMILVHYHRSIKYAI